MHQPVGEPITSSDAGITANVLDPQHARIRRDAPRFSEWIEPGSDATTDTEVSRLVREQEKKLNCGPVGAEDNRKPGFCRISTSSGYSSQQQSPPLSGGDGSCHPGCCPKNSSILPQQLDPSHQPSGNQIGPLSSLAVIHEGEAIPRPIWPYMGDDFREASTGDGLPLRYDAKSSYAATNVAYEACGCDYCGNESRIYRDEGLLGNGASAKQVLLELSRTLNSVIDASESDTDLNAEEILRDISITVARGIGNQQPKEDRRSSIIEQDCQMSSSSSSAAGKESLVGVNPVNLRVYGKPKWLQVPSTRSSSQCPYEAKTLLTAVSRKASRATPAMNAGNSNRVPTVFLVPAHGNSFHPNIGCNTARMNATKLPDGKNPTLRNESIGRFETSTNRTNQGRSQGRGDNCNDKCPGEPVYSTQLGGSDESSSYGAIGESPTATKNNVWTGSSKVFDPHLDFTLDGNRAERLGRAIAKAKRKRQWCRGLTAILGLVFFVLSVVIVSLSVTRGRKVFGSM